MNRQSPLIRFQVTFLSSAAGVLEQKLQLGWGPTFETLWTCRSLGMLPWTVPAVMPALS